MPLLSTNEQKMTTLTMAMTLSEAANFETKFVVDGVSQLLAIYYAYYLKCSWVIPRFLAKKFSLINLSNFDGCYIA